MKPNSRYLSMLGALVAAAFLIHPAARAQANPEEQAKTILQLFENGQKDTAYALLEPLKKSARFVPAVIYTRAQMTPDDRALALYKEIMALEPGGSWAEKSAYQLVMRYADKRDSLAAHTWAGVLKTNYAKSSLVAGADKILSEVTSWRTPDEDMADVSPGKKSSAKDNTAKSSKSAAKTSAKSATTPATSKSAPKPATAAKTAAATKPTTPAKTTSNPQSSETYKSTGLNGFALQVGVFPTKELAQARSNELRGRKIRAYALPKPSAGQGFYAVVIGPYATKEEANKKKSIVDGLCGCDSFRVEVK
jgi:cell division septation protein DedD